MSFLHGASQTIYLLIDRSFYLLKVRGRRGTNERVFISSVATFKSRACVESFRLFFVDNKKQFKRITSSELRLNIWRVGIVINTGIIMQISILRIRNDSSNVWKFRAKNLHPFGWSTTRNHTLYVQRHAFSGYSLSLMFYTKMHVVRCFANSLGKLPLYVYIHVYTVYFYRTHHVVA